MKTEAKNMPVQRSLFLLAFQGEKEIEKRGLFSDCWLEKEENFRYEIGRKIKDKILGYAQK